MSRSLPGVSREIPFFDFPDSDPVLAWTWLAPKPMTVMAAANQVVFFAELMVKMVERLDELKRGDV
jgi:hypothetical protein